MNPDPFSKLFLFSFLSALLVLSIWVGVAWLRDNPDLPEGYVTARNGISRTDFEDATFFSMYTTFSKTPAVALSCVPKEKTP